MSAKDLSLGLGEMFSEIRAAGKGASHSRIEAIVDSHFPILLRAFDPHAELRMSEESSSRGWDAIEQRANETSSRIQAGLDGPHPNGAGIGVEWPWKRGHLSRPGSRRLSWGLAFAGAAALVLIGIFLYQATRKDTFIVHPGPPPESVSPSQKTPAPRLEGGPDKAHERGHVVENGPETRIKSVPNRPLRQDPRREPTKLAQKEAAGALGAVMGEPRILIANGYVPIIGVPGTKLPAGATIETGDADKCEVRFGDGTLVRMDFNTRVRVPETAAPAASGSRPEYVRLESGKIYASVVHRADERRFRVETPAATAEVLGTEFGLKLEKLAKSTKATLQVKQGRVRFFNGLGEQVATDQTETWATESTKPTEPKRIRTFTVADKRTGQMFLHTHRGQTARMIASKLVDVTGDTGIEVEDVLPGWPDFEAPSVFASKKDGQKIETKAVGPTRVQVVHVEPTSPGGRAGIREGDVILRIGGSPIQFARQADEAMLGREGDQVVLVIVRDGKELEFAIRLEDEGRRLPRPRLSAKEVALLHPATRFLLGGEAEAAIKYLLAFPPKQQKAHVHNHLAVAYLMQERMGLAIRHFSEAVRLAPNEPRYRWSLSQALTNIGNLDRGLEEARENVRRNPSVEDVWAQLSRAYLHVGDFEKQLDATKHAQKLVPEDHGAWNMLAGAYLQHRQFDLALAAVKEALRRHPNCSDAHVRLAEVEWAKDNLQAPESHYLRAIELNPNNRAALLGISHVIDHTKQPGRARVYVERAWQLCPEDVDVLEGLAATLAFARDFVAAEAVARKAIALDPTSSQAYNGLGVAFSESGRFERAIAAYQKALSLAPGSVMICRNIAECYERLNQIDKAVEYYQRALALDPDSTMVLASLGQMLHRVGRLEEALPHLSRWLKLTPQYWQPYSWVSNILLRLGRFAEAEKIDREWMKLVPRYSFPHWHLAQALIELDPKSEEALAMALKSLELAENEPAKGNALATLGLVYLRRGELDAAEEYLRKALAIQEVASRWRNLGETLELKGQKPEAIVAFQKALKLDPKESRALAGLKRLGG